nr:hypothetical protein [Mycobacterium genavense]
MELQRGFTAEDTVLLHIETAFWRGLSQAVPQRLQFAPLSTNGVHPATGDNRQQTRDCGECGATDGLPEKVHAVDLDPVRAGV